MWGPCKGKGKGKGGDAYGGAYGKDPYGKGDAYGGAWGKGSAYDFPYGKGGYGKGDAYGGAYGGGYGASPYDLYGALKGALGGMKGGKYGGKMEMDVWGGGGEDEWSGGGGGKKKRGGGGGGEWAEIEGLKDALSEAFGAAGLSDEADVEDVMKRVYKAAQKQSIQFAGDERASQKMNALQAKAFLQEFVENVMAAMSNFLYEKSWFEKVSWNGVLLVIVLHTFHNGKIFTRILKPDIIQGIDDALLAWSEEERITKRFWEAIEAAGITGTHAKKANTHLQKAYDEAHAANLGTTGDDNVSPEVAQVQDFAKAWIAIFADKAFSVLQNGLPDTTAGGQVAALTTMFQTLMDPNSPCLPLILQPSLPSAPWPYIETAANEVITAAGA